ncbi:DUF6151 family protein [Massilia sp. BSC265]|uniref:DUF6151 family protein n=1 Tax=Massilia sp. BSC265 TaxID=1549812 RepID=UPI0004E8B672|nr:DUF6151 family protein [Massilia sp. BSC265]KFI05545.1 hypothetical protein JN27_20900 [Massilia sp. BSC265]
MTIALRCRCGQLRGQVDPGRVAARAVCYCKDCQAYGHFLGTGVLDTAGGTEVAATLPAAVRFDAGLEHLACMSLGPKGIYRWYASCCRTPIGNTPRDPRTSYVGLVRACLDAPDAELERQLGPLRCRVETQSASSPVASSGLSTAWAVCKIGTMIVKARLGGGYRENPFFRPQTSEPVKPVQVLSLQERKALTP